MSMDLEMDPRDFAERLERSFGVEPPHTDVAADLARGRRARRRRRAVTGIAGLGVAATVAAAAVVVPAALEPAPPVSAPWAAGEASDAQVVHDCLEVNDRVSVGGRDEVVSRTELLQRMGAARLMTRADVGPITLATLRSGDRSVWLECHLSRREPALKAITLLYPTDVGFPRTTVGGVRAYEPHDEADPRLSGTATSSVPRVAVDCDVQQPEETVEWAREAASCPTYTLTWNDRRPSEVARATVVAPDGQLLEADVQDGYLSLAWSAPVTQEMSDQIAAGTTPEVRRVVFYDSEGKVLVDDPDPGHVPTSTDPGIGNFPSLAWWLR